MTLRLWLKRLLALGRRRRYDQELADELAAHLELAERDAMLSGLSPAEAARQARLRFGAIERIREEHRDSRSLRSLERIARDARHAVRSLLRTPAFTVTAVLTLALGIGAATAIFSVVYGVLLKPLPYAEPDRLVTLYHLAPGVNPDPRGPQTSASYFTYRDNNRTFEDIGLSPWRANSVTVTRSGEPYEVRAQSITDGLLPVLGVRPELGRFFEKKDVVPGAPNRVVLTHAYWQQAFGGARDVLGQSMTIGTPGATPYEIIGVLPASFRLPGVDVQLLLPLQLDRTNANPGGFGYRGIARLKPGVTVDQAGADIARMIPLITKLFPLPAGVTQEMWDDVGLAPNVIPLADDVIGEMHRPLWILLGTVTIVLVMAWANVANLLLVRVENRQRELAVRRALGASSSRITIALMVESLILAFAGGSLGIIFAQACIGLLRTLAPDALPRVDEIAIDGVVLLATLVACLGTSFLCGLAAVLRCRPLNVEGLKETGRSISDAPSHHRTRSTIVVAQVALSLVSLIGSGLMVRTFVAMRHVAPGFVRPAEVQTFGIALPAILIPDRREAARTYEEVAERLGQVPGVEAVGLARDLIMDGSTPTGPVSIEDRPVEGLAPWRRQRSIGPGYFEAMRNALIAGRAFTWADIHARARIAIVSENLAREYWGESAKALGKRIRFRPQDPWSEIVGVVGNERDDGMNQPAPPTVFWPMARAIPEVSYLVRSDRVGSTGFLRELQQAVWSVNPSVPLRTVRTLEMIQAESMSQTSFAMVMLTIAAGVSLLLALVGIYGVVSYIVTERTHEIGIRMALGAHAGDVRSLFLWRGLTLTVVGSILGTAAALLLTPLMSALLYDVTPTDPVTYAIGALLLGAATLLATYLPARRASRLSPTVALRSRR